MTCNLLVESDSPSLLIGEDQDQNLKFYSRTQKMFATTFTSGNHNYYCFVAVSLLMCLGLPITFGQSITTPTTTQETIPVNTANHTERYPVTSPTTTASSVTTARPIITTNYSSPIPVSTSPHQPISYKFTLVAGKFWKFVIKSNSFPNYKEGELRLLHKNVSGGNYIVEDGEWFQYNPQQQQLFAWPGFYTKPGTYYFVLVPSKVDIEEDNENTVSQLIAANIVVELIRPLLSIPDSNLDQLIDHRFSLEYLHRHSTYPLVQQIVSILLQIGGEAISKSNNSQTLIQQNSPTTVAPSTTGGFLKGQKLTNKLNDYLLIHYSHEGDSFSLSWTTHPSLSNNTLTRISDCRVTTINETVSRLSRLKSGSQHGSEKFTLYYPIDASFESSQAIVPEERGNFSLKLTLHGPCQSAKHIEELGIAIINKTDGIITDADYKENNIEDLQSTQTSAITTSSPEPTTISSSTTPSLPAPGVTDAIAAQITTPNLTTPSAQEITTLNTSVVIPANITSVLLQTTTDLIPNVDVISSTPATHTSTTVVSTQGTLLPDQLTAEVTRIDAAPTQIAVDVQNKTSLDKQVKSEDPPVEQQQQPKPQTKSLDSTFLDSTDVAETAMSTTLAPRITTTVSSSVLLSNQSINSNSSTKDASVSTLNESSLNEDFMGIINEVMDYLVEFAVPVSIIIGLILLVCIFIALCNLCIKRKKTKEFEVKNRFSFRYGSERRAFLKNSSKPVILDVDQKSISMGGTPQHKSSKKDCKKKRYTGSDGHETTSSYLPMHMFAWSNGGCSSDVGGDTNTGSGHGHASGGDCGGGGDFGGGDCGGGGDFGGGDCGGGGF